MDTVRGLQAGGAWNKRGTMLEGMSRACALGAFREGSLSIPCLTQPDSKVPLQDKERKKKTLIYG